MDEVLEETTTVRIRKTVQKKLKRAAALEGMTLFELMDVATTEFVAQKEKAGYNLATPTPSDSREWLSHLIRRASRRTLADQGADSVHEAAEPVGHTREVSEYEKGIKKGNKRQISHTLAPDMLQWVDETAKRYGISRAALINLCLRKELPNF